MLADDSPSQPSEETDRTNETLETGPPTEPQTEQRPKRAATLNTQDCILAQVKTDVDNVNGGRMLETLNSYYILFIVIDM